VTLLPIRHVADLVGLHWHTVKTIDKQRLLRDLPAPDPTRLRRLMMDEFALHKRHRYATVVACADTQQVVWIGEGRSRDAIRPFFEWLGEAREQIEAVAMDMNSAMALRGKALDLACWWPSRAMRICAMYEKLPSLLRRFRIVANLHLPGTKSKTPQVPNQYQRASKTRLNYYKYVQLWQIRQPPQPAWILA
ncbi:transposase, partial [Halomonas faecis]|uniref:transposase n=1 Tax=Halomonas faecis TaxID=1562110 RepID=UPI00387E4BD9